MEPVHRSFGQEFAYTVSRGKVATLRPKRKRGTGTAKTKDAIGKDDEGGEYADDGQDTATNAGRDSDEPDADIGTGDGAGTAEAEAESDMSEGLGSGRGDDDPAGDDGYTADGDRDTADGDGDPAAGDGHSGGQGVP